MLPFLWWCRFFRSQASSSAGVHSSLVELTSLAVSLSSSLIADKPNYAGLAEFCVSLAMCESSIVPLFLVGIMPNSGVAVLLRD